MYSVARCRGDRREVDSVGVIHVVRGLVIGVVLVVVVVLSRRSPAVDSSDRWLDALAADSSVR